MNTYARLQNGIVAELITMKANPLDLFNPELQWVTVTEPGVAPGWVASVNGKTNMPTFSPPPPETSGLPVPPSLAQLQTELAALAAKIALLSASNKAGG